MAEGGAAVAAGRASGGARKTRGEEGERSEASVEGNRGDGEGETEKADGDGPAGCCGVTDRQWRGWRGGEEESATTG